MGEGVIRVFDAKLILITGQRQAGKSTLCERLVGELRAASVAVSGLITRRTGPHDQEVLELRSGQTYPLTLPFAEVEGSATPHFRMDPAALARALDALRESFPTQVFILDEIGPLELKRGQGWAAALDWLATERYAAALVVIRPELLGDLVARLALPWYTVVNVTPDNRDQVLARLVAMISALIGGMGD